MRIKALASCAKEDGLITLLDEITSESKIVRQYVMLPNRAIYPLDGMPFLNEDTLLTVMDVPKEKRDAYQVNRAQLTERLRLAVADAKATDTEVPPGLITIGMCGRTMIPLIGGDGKAFFVDNELLKVLADMRALTIAERLVDGSRVFVVQQGMLTVACLMPSYDFWGEKQAQQLWAAGMAAEKVYRDWDVNHK